jgi:hypothetical protein
MIRFTHGDGTAYVTLGPAFHKSLEVGGGRASKGARRVDFNVNFNTWGDHAGLRVYLGWRGLMFELNVTDTRHWDWSNDRFYGPGEEPEFEDNTRE